MTIKEFIFLVINVLKDWHVIATAVVMIFVIWFANFIINYRRRPRRNKKKKNAPVAVPKSAPDLSDDENKPAMSENEAGE